MPLSGLTAAEAFWIDHVRKNVVGRLAGSAFERARTAAVVMWWALKEGVLDVRPSPWRHNLCAGGGTQGQIGDLDVCFGPTWQLGMSGIQPSAVTLPQVEAMALQLYPGESISSILGRVATEAGVDAGTRDAIVASSGELRKAWLLRDPAISFELQRPFVERCLRSSAPSWCFGSWDTARRFASSPQQINAVISELENDFQGSIPPSSSSAGRNLLPWAILLGSAGLFAYAYAQEKGYPNWAKRFTF